MTTDWQDDAACRGMNPDLFFPHQGAGYIEAQKICATCPVRFYCAEAAIQAREEFGVWGGLTEAERRRVIKHRAGFEDQRYKRRTYDDLTRERAVILFGEIREKCRTEWSAYKAVAKRLGVSDAASVAGWVRKAREAETADLSLDHTPGDSSPANNTREPAAAR